MRRLTTAILASTILASLNFGAAAETDLRVVTSIKPVHSLVASVMQGVGVPVLLLEGTASPHSYSLKPSQAQHLQAADIIFWMGHDLEVFLDNAIDIGHGGRHALLDNHDLFICPAAVVIHGLGNGSIRGLHALFKGIDTLV